MFGGLELKQPGSSSTSSNSNNNNHNNNNNNNSSTNEASITSPPPAESTSTNEELNASNSAPTDSITDSIGSAFSFLQSSFTPAPLPVLPGTTTNTNTNTNTNTSTSTDVEGSATDGETVDVVKEEETMHTDPDPVEASTSTSTSNGNATSSGFSFMASASSSSVSINETIPNTVSSVPAEPTPAATSVASSGFSFLANPTSTSSTNINALGTQAALPSTTPAPPSPASGFSFLSTPSQPVAPIAPSPPPPATELPPTNTPLAPISISTSTSTSAWAPPSVPTKKIPPTSPPSSTDPSSDLLSMTMPSSTPATSGMVFSTSTKKVIKKRRAKSKIGTAAIPPTNTPNPLPSSLPSSSSSHPYKDNGSTKDDAEQSRQKAEVFLAEKLRETSKPEEGLEDPEPSPAQTLPVIPVSPTYAAAQAAAEEAKSLQLPAKKRPILRNLFGKSRSNLPFFRDTSNPNITPTPHNSMTILKDPEQDYASGEEEEEDMQDSSYSTPGIEIHHSDAHMETHSMSSDYPVPMTMNTTTSTITPPKAEEDRLALLRREEEKRLQAQAAEALRLKLQQEQEQLEYQKRLEEDAKPENHYKYLLTSFQTSTNTAISNVTQLRSHRSKLVQEYTQAEKKQNLASHQIQQAESQQMKAAELEDYELADRLANVIESYEADLKEQTSILEHIEKAILEVDSQRESVVQGLTDCFVSIQQDLSSFQSEQDTVEKEDANEAMEKFATTSKKLSVEDERLSNEMKHIERDEGIVEEERKQIESSISDQCKDEEELRMETKSQLSAVHDEIEALEKLLESKKEIREKLSSDLSIHEDAIAKVREKFSRQLTRLGKKEASVTENRNEWNLEKTSLEQMKEQHESELQAHHEALLSYEQMIDAVKEDIGVAKQLESVIAKEIVVEIISSEEEDELAILRSDLVKSEAAVVEANQLVATAEGVIESLMEEATNIDVRLPILEAEKRLAASKRDFKGAGKASRELKEAQARKDQCITEIEGDAKERVDSTKNDLERLKEVLEEKKSIVHEQEKEKGISSMVEIAQKMKRLRNARDDICKDVTSEDKDEINVALVGNFVLNGEIDVLVARGEHLDEEFGGWTGILEAQEEETNEAEVPSEDNIEETEEKMEQDDEGNDDEKELNNNDDEANDGDNESLSSETKEEDEAVTNSDEIDEKEEEAPMEEDETGIPTDTVLKWKELTDKLNEVATSLDEAVEIEDYDVAAELDEQLEKLKSNIDDLGFSDEELQAAMEAMHISSDE